MFQTILQLLIVEKVPKDYSEIKKYVDEGFPSINILYAESFYDGFHHSTDQHPDLILLHLTTPDKTDINFLYPGTVKTAEIPVIILASAKNAHNVLECLQNTGQDYLVKKGSYPLSLATSIEEGIESSKTNAGLKKSEEQFKYLFYSNPLAMCVCDKTRKFLIANKTALHLYDYSEDEFLGLTIGELELSAKERVTNNNSALRESGNYKTFLQHQKKNKEIIDVEIKYQDIIFKGQQACLIVINDLTERNRDQKKLQESEEMFKTIVENFPNGFVAILNKELIISYIAGQQFHIPATSATRFKNTLYTSHFYSPNKEKVFDKLIKVFDDNSIVFEAAYDKLSYLISATPIHEADGQIDKILIASQDITEQKRNETEKELLIEKLMQTNSEHQQFSYITSHNLRSPLSNLLGLIQLLDISSISDANTIFLLKKFEEAALKLNDTVNDLVNILVIKNNIHSKKEKVDIKNTLEKVVQSVETVIKQKNVSIISDFSQAAEVDFNHVYLESILLNLVTNAVKYSSPTRTPEIKIITEKVDNGVKMWFSDNGLGIDLITNKNRIFGLYQRFHDNADSIGLGLYMVNTQIHAMGGEIDVKSKVDEGTTFIITFKNQ